MPTAGTLSFGVRERRKGSEAKSPSVAVADLGSAANDDTLLRTESTIRDNIEPQIPVLRTKIVKCEEGNVVVVRIPADDAPGRYACDENHLFWGNTGCFFPKIGTRTNDSKY